MNEQTTTTTCERCHSGCSYCGGERLLLGRLGKLLHFRCENCGLQTSSELPEDDFGDVDYHDDYDDDYESPLDGSEDVDGNVDDDDDDHNNIDGDLDEDGRHNR